MLNETFSVIFKHCGTAVKPTKFQLLWKKMKVLVSSLDIISKWKTKCQTRHAMLDLTDLKEDETHFFCSGWQFCVFLAEFSIPFFHYLGHAFLREWNCLWNYSPWNHLAWFRSLCSRVTGVSKTNICNCIAIRQSFLWQIEWKQSKVFFWKFFTSIG